MTRKNGNMDLATAIRKAIETSGMNLLAVSKLSGLHYGPLHRFANGGGGITLTSASKLCSALGMELRKRK